MAEKGFFDIFDLYKPTGLLYSELSSATGILVRADKARRYLEISCHFSRPLDKELLYEAEAKMAEIYRMNSVRILPKYPSECFDEDYISQILLETERIGLVAKGFFSHYDVECVGDRITITIPFGEGGVHLLYDAKTPSVIERILKAEFDLNFEVKIEQNANASMYMQEVQAREMERLDAEVRAASVAYASRPRGGSESAYTPKASSAEPSEPSLPRVASLLKEGKAATLENGIFSIFFEKCYKNVKKTYFTTILNIFPGTKISFTIVLPVISSAILSFAITVAIAVSLSQSLGIVIVPLILPFI